jgi:uncharacterized protein (DUF3084 family)
MGKTDFAESLGVMASQNEALRRQSAIIEDLRKELEDLRKDLKTALPAEVAAAVGGELHKALGEARKAGEAGAEAVREAASVLGSLGETREGLKASAEAAASLQWNLGEAARLVESTRGGLWMPWWTVVAMAILFGAFGLVTALAVLRMLGLA